MEVKISRLESIVEQLAETTIDTSETIEGLTHRIDALASQVQQQGCQILALSKALQTLAENQEQSMQQLTQVTETLQRLMAARAAKEPPDS